MGVRTTGIWTLVTLLLISLAARLSRWPTPEAIVLGGGEYDPSVMYLAAARFVHGELPYRDFVFLHPPGVLLGLAPSVWLGGLIGDSAGLALARALVVLLGLVNTGLVAHLLRPYGRGSVILGAGLYAGWSALAYTEQQPLLEPILVTALLIALVLLRSDARWSAAIMGLILGVATMVKVWAALDIIYLAVVVLVARGGLALVRFVTGVVVGGCALGLPFFLAAPGAMWEMLVVTQLTRENEGVAFTERVAMFGPAPYLNHPVYVAVMAGALVAAMALAAILAVRGVFHRSGALERAEPALWGGLALLHGAVMLLTASFYDHYAMFVAAPLTLVLGAAASWFRTADERRARLSITLLWLGITAIAVTSMAGSLYRVVTTDHMTLAERNRLSVVADSFGCTWSPVPTRILIDEVVDGLRDGCEITVDPYGESLLAQARGREDWREARRESEAPALGAADAVIVPSDSDQALQRSLSQAKFVVKEQIGNYTLWTREGA